MIGRIRKILAVPEPDFLPGDLAGEMVRVRGKRGVALLERIDGDHATVAWGKDRREIVPLVDLHRVGHRGSSFDRRVL